MDSELDRLAAWQQALAGFDAVWARVSGAPPARPAPRAAGAERLRQLGEEAAQAASYDRTLAGRFRGGGRALLLRHAAQEQRLACSLRAEAFLADGVLRPVTASCPRLRGGIAALRDAMLRDSDAAEAFTRAAEDSRPGETAELLLNHAETARRLAEEKRGLIRRCVQ